MNQEDDSLSDEYDFSPGVRGKYAGRIKAPPLHIVIEPELTKEFPTEKAVNDALRELLRRRSGESRPRRD